MPDGLVLIIRSNKNDLPGGVRTISKHTAVPTIVEHTAIPVNHPVDIGGMFKISPNHGYRRGPFRVVDISFTDDANERRRAPPAFLRRDVGGPNEIRWQFVTKVKPPESAVALKKGGSLSKRRDAHPSTRPRGIGLVRVTPHTAKKPLKATRRLGRSTEGSDRRGPGAEKLCIHWIIITPRPIKRRVCIKIMCNYVPVAAGLVAPATPFDCYLGGIAPGRNPPFDR